MVRVRELAISGARVFEPVVHRDDRGLFLEWFRHEPVSEGRGEPFELRQANLSVSSRGVLRGIHVTTSEAGQAKYVTVVAGSVVDYVVDLRDGSPTFGDWAAVPLDDVDRHAVYLPEGLGHGFVVLSETATVCYLASTVYDPEHDVTIDALDPEIGLRLPDGLAVSRSPRDEAAPSLAAARAAGLLPRGPELR